jgi:hypothetical protein
MKMPEVLLFGVLAMGALVAGAPGFKPAGSVSHADHDDTHVGYTLSVSVNTFKTGVTVAQADAAVDAFMFEVTKRDDLIVLSAFCANCEPLSAASKYVLASTWRTTAGQQASEAAALGISAGNYLTRLTEETEYVGVLSNFYELLEVHSAAEDGYTTSVRIATLTQPTVQNATAISPQIESGLRPIFEGLTGAVDYTVLFPTLPVANEKLVAQATWNSTASEAAGITPLSSWYSSSLPSVTTDVVYSGVIRNFWHSAPGTTPADGTGTGTPTSTGGTTTASGMTTKPEAFVAAVLVAALAVLAA